MPDTAITPDRAHRIEFDERLRRAVQARTTPVVPPDGQMLRWVPVSDLMIDGSYQRMISDRGIGAIRRIIQDFSWSRFGALIVTEHHAGPADGLVVIDGQHRAIAASHLGIEEVPAIVAPWRDAAHQAGDFVGINCTRTNVASIDKFRARVTAGDQVACDVAGILSELNISTDVPPGTSLRPYQTRAVSRLEKLVKAYGRGTVYTALDMLIDAQGEQPDLLTATTIWATVAATDALLTAEGDIEAFAKLLEVIDFETLAEQGRELVKLRGGQGGIRAAEQLLAAYNKGRQKKVTL